MDLDESVTLNDQKYGNNLSLTNVIRLPFVLLTWSVGPLVSRSIGHDNYMCIGLTLVSLFNVTARRRQKTRRPGL